MRRAAASMLPQPGGQAQLCPYRPQRPDAHISRTASSGTAAAIFSCAQWEKPFCAASVSGSFICKAS